MVSICTSGRSTSVNEHIYNHRCPQLTLKTVWDFILILNLRLEAAAQTHPSFDNGRLKETGNLRSNVSRLARRCPTEIRVLEPLRTSVPRSEWGSHDAMNLLPLTVEHVALPVQRSGRWCIEKKSWDMWGQSWGSWHCIWLCRKQRTPRRKCRALYARTFSEQAQ